MGRPLARKPSLITSLGADAVIDHHQPLDELNATGYEQVDMVVSLNQTDHRLRRSSMSKTQGKLALIDDPELIDVRKLKLKPVTALS